jgi:hypothetical protein
MGWWGVRAAIARVVGGVGLVLALGSGAMAAITCAALNNTQVTFNQLFEITDAKAGDVITVQVPAGTTASVQGQTRVGPTTVTIPVTTPGLFTLSIFLTSGPGPVTVTTSCGSSSSTNSGINQNLLNALTQIGARTSLTNFSTMLDRQLQQRQQDQVRNQEAQEMLRQREILLRFIADLKN